MTFMDRLKQRAEELDLQHKADQFADAATKAAHEARERVGELAHENRAKVAEVVEKAGAAVDERTDGKYADKVAKAKQQVAKGVDKLAEQRGSAGHDSPQDASPAVQHVVPPVAPPVVPPVVPPIVPAPVAPPIVPAPPQDSLD